MANDSARYAGHELMYEVRVRGQLGAGSSEAFVGLGVTVAVDGDTLLVGPVVDQAALHGVLRKVRDLGLTLLSVESALHETRSRTPNE